MLDAPPVAAAIVQRPPQRLVKTRWPFDEMFHQRPRSERRHHPATGQKRRAGVGDHRRFTIPPGRDLAEIGIGDRVRVHRQHRTARKPGAQFGDGSSSAKRLRRFDADKGTIADMLCQHLGVRVYIHGSRKARIDQSIKRPIDQRVSADGTEHLRELSRQR